MAITPQEITPKAMIDLKKNLDEAKEDNTPFVGVVENADKSEMLIIGDANKTENKSHDYTVMMRYPKEMATHIDEKDIIKTVGDYVFFEVEFKDIKILPRKNMQIIASIAGFMPFFFDLQENGDTEDASDERLIQIAMELSGDVLDSMYALVGAFFDIKQETWDYILPSSIIGTVAKLIEDFPEAFNETDFI